MARSETEISIRIVNWPIYGRARSFSFGQSIFPTSEALTQWARNRFGRGQLVSVGENAWEYRREVTGPGGVWELFTKLLNRSFD